MKFRVGLVLLGLCAPIAFAHWFAVLPIANPVPVVGAPTTGAPVVTTTPVSSTTAWFCVRSNGQQDGGPYATSVLGETPCGTLTAGDGVTRYLEERVTATNSTTTTQTSTQITRTRRFEVQGSTQLRVSSAAAQLLVISSGGGGSPGGGGDIAHGELFTINGSGFGTRTDNNEDNYTWYGHDHLHFRFTTFENGAPVDDTEEADWLTATSGFAPDRITPGDARLTIITGSGAADPFYLRRTHFQGSAEADRNGGLSVRAVDTGNAPVGGPIYAGFRWRYPAHQNGNSKLFRLYYQSSRSTYIDTGTDGASYRFSVYREPDYVGMSGASIEDTSPPAQNTWHLIEVQLLGGAATSHISVEGVEHTFANSNPFSSTDLPIMATDDDNGGHTIDFPNMVETQTGTDAHYDYDMIVVDWSMARVLLGNASTYGASTLFEFQPVISWSNTQIQIAINQGQHANLTGKYLYVFDGDNVLVDTDGIPLTMFTVPVLAWRRRRAANDDRFEQRMAA